MYAEDITLQATIYFIFGGIFLQPQRQCRFLALETAYNGITAHGAWQTANRPDS